MARKNKQSHLTQRQIAQAKQVIRTLLQGNEKRRTESNIAHHLQLTVEETRPILSAMNAAGELSCEVVADGIALYSLAPAKATQVKSLLQFRDLTGYTAGILRACETRMALRGAGWRLPSIVA